MSGRRPSVGEAGAVVVPEGVVLVTLRRRPSGPRRRAVGEVPAQQEGIRGFAAGRNFALQAERADAGALGGFRAELPIFGEVVPEEHGAGPPLGGGPAAQVTHPASTGVEQAERAGEDT